MVQQIAKLVLVTVLAMHCQMAFADTVYFLNSQTSNADSARLVSGYFRTDGTVGDGIRLGDVLTSWEITVEEDQHAITLTPDNSFNDFNNFEYFTVTSDAILIVEDVIHSAGPSQFRINGFNNDGRYFVTATPAGIRVGVSAFPGETLITIPLDFPFSVATNGTLLGDVNNDSRVDLLDIQPFVDLIVSGKFELAADINLDGVVDLTDVEGFVELLTGS